MNKTWIKVNLFFVRFLAVLMVGGILWGWDYISKLNTEWFGYPILCGIFCICIYLTAGVLVLNVIATILANKDLSEDSN